MKKVLIATTNADKYRIVKSIFQETIFPKKEYIINSLKDIDVELEDKKEIGNNIERARAKAIQAQKELQDLEFDYYVGLDDAIKIKGKIEPNIKEYINKILYENYISDGEEYAFSRAYCIIDKNGNIKETTAEIPYIYKENKNVVVKEHTYPLSEVAFPIGYDVPLTSLTPEEELAYYLKYVKEALLNLDI